MTKDPSDEYKDEIDEKFYLETLGLAKKSVEEDMLRPVQLLPKNVLLQRRQKELQQEFSTYRKQQEQGALSLVQSLQELAKEIPEFFSEEVMQAMNQIGALSESIIKDEGHITEQLSQGVSLQELASVDDTVLDKLYQGASHLYQKGLFSEAANAFAFLTGLNPKKYLFWLGLAHSEFRCKHYKEAQEAYSVVCAACPADITSHLALSRCYVEIGQTAKAIDVLDLALLAMEEKQEYANWKDQVTQEKERLLKKL